MALSPISAIGNATPFIPPPITARQLTPAESFIQTVETALSGPLAPAAGLRAATTETEFVSALERALFTNWVNSVQNTDSVTLAPTIDALLAGELGITGPIRGTTPTLPFDTSDPQSLILTSRLVSLFSTMQLLGTDTNPAPSLGSFLDLTV